MHIMSQYIITDETGRRYYDGRSWTLNREQAAIYNRLQANDTASRVGGTPEKAQAEFIC
jgi:hypothetical protein